MNGKNARSKKLRQSKASKNIKNSGLVLSSQTSVHPNLEKYVRQHLQTSWRQPFHRPTIDVYRQLRKSGVFSSGQPLVLDSGCGTGKSTVQLAGAHPRHLVLGVDQSLARLSRGGMTAPIFQSENCILLRAELATFWRLLAKDNCCPERHFIYYPNPWPKPGHLSRRWHGHPVFPELLSLGGEIEVRCNWEIYALEFALAVQMATGEVIAAKRIQPKSGVSPFEQKYLERGHQLFSVLVPAEVTSNFRHTGMAN